MTSFDGEAIDGQRAMLEARGVVFCDMATARREFPQFVGPHAAKVFAADRARRVGTRSGSWSYDSFVYVPPGVDADVPIERPNRQEAADRGPLVRTVLVADEGSRVQYFDGCSAPTYTSASLQAAAVDVVVKPGAHVTYTTIQNWSSNVYHLVSKRAYVEAEGQMRWTDANLGGRVAVSCPAMWLVGPGASGEVLSVSVAGRGQSLDVGAKVVHLAPETESTIVSKALVHEGGRVQHRGLVQIEPRADRCTSQLRCDALVLDDVSAATADPHFDIGTSDATIGHEVSTSHLADAQLFYLACRGLSRVQAMAVIANGFVDPVVSTVPVAYAVEWSRMIEHHVAGPIG